MSRIRHARVVATYATSVVASAVVTLVSIPVVISAAGPTAWAGLATGQSIGTGAAVLIGFGWGTTGPTEVARTVGEARTLIYAESLRARLLLGFPIGAAAVVLTIAVVPAAPLASALSAVAFAGTGLLAGWFFTGASQPGRFILLDTGPRVLGSAVGVAAVALGAPVLWFPGLQMVGIAFGIVFSTIAVSGVAAIRAGWSLRLTIETLRRQSSGLVLSAVSAANAALPAVIVATLAPSALPSYALADKLLRFGTTAASPFIQFLQGWVPSGGVSNLAARARRALMIGGSLVLIGTASFAAVAPATSNLLSHGRIVLPWELIAAFTAVLMILVGSQVVGLVCLLALGQQRLLARFSLISGVTTVPLVLLGALAFGAGGAAAGVALGELVAFLPQSVLLYNVLKKHRQRTSDVTL